MRNPTCILLHLSHNTESYKERKRLKNLTFVLNSPNDENSQQVPAKMPAIVKLNMSDYLCD